MQNAVLEDSDEYVCRIRNKFGSDSVAAKLLVRRKFINNCASLSSQYPTTDLENTSKEHSIILDRLGS